MVGGLLNFRTMAVVLAPALFTLGKLAVGLAGGLVALGVVAGAAAAPWVALAVTAAKNADKMGPAGARFEAGAAGVKSAWMDLARRTAALTLGPLTDVLDGITAAIPKLEPLVRDVAPSFQQMGRDLKSWLSGNGFERFIDHVRQYGVPAFRNLVDAGRDAAVTVGIGFRTFLPMARDIEQTLRRGARNVRAFGEGGGFQRLLDSIKQDGPEANRALSEAGKTLRTVAGLLDKMGPGQLGTINRMLELFNGIDPGKLKDLVLFYATGRFLIGGMQVLAGLLTMLAGGISIRGGAALLASSGSLKGVALVLGAMAIAVSGMAKTVKETARSTRLDTSALDRIRDIWNSVPKNTTTRLAAPSLNMAVVVAMGVSTTWATLQAKSGETATFRAECNIMAYGLITAGMLVIWATVRALAIMPAMFRAGAVPGNVLMAAQTLMMLWGRVRGLAAVPAVFRVTASPGNVAAVASQVIAAWARVRAAAAVVPRFTARGISGPVVAGAATIVAAWARVRAMPKRWMATGRVNPAGAVSGSARTVSAWRGVLSMPRSWSAVATVNVSGGFSGITGGSVNLNMPDLFVTHVPITIGRPGTGPNIPDFPDPGYGMGNWGAGDRDDPGYDGYQGGEQSGSDYFPDDFSGGFARGGPIGNRFSSVAGLTRRNRDRHIHIYDDVWVANQDDLTALLEEALSEAR
ncbi:hypothetical protein [Streptomyces sp. NPDC002855]|uniref:hypothetical protein n=1 Tax=Streptomyces sp. NPDC002855 TaxID=3154437 RepID=UPI00331FEE99